MLLRMQAPGKAGGGARSIGPLRPRDYGGASLGPADTLAGPMRVFALAFLVLLGAAPAPRRVLSMNLCADQYLIALADPGQIAGLSRLARDPKISAAAAAARSLPIAGATAEEVLALAPDLVLTGWAGQADMAVRLGAMARVVALSPANSYADIVTQVRLVAGALGQRARGEALIARMDRALAAIPRTGRSRVAADYQRRGFLGGPDTLVDEMMRRVGLANLAARLGRPALSRLSLEEIVAARPDMILAGTGSDDLGSAMVRHPVLHAIPRLRIPGALVTCGGPAFPVAVAALSAQAARIP